MSEPIASTPLAAIKNAKNRAKLAELAAEYRALSDQKAAIEAAQKGLMDEIEPLRAATGFAKISGEGWDIVRVHQDRRSINRDKLLSNGVTLDVIEASTDVKPVDYTQIVAQKTKKS